MQFQELLGSGICTCAYMMYKLKGATPTAAPALHEWDIHVWAGDQVVPVWDGDQVVPVWAGDQVVPVWDGDQVVPVWAGDQVVPA